MKRWNLMLALGLTGLLAACPAGATTEEYATLLYQGYGSLRIETGEGKVI